MSKKNNLNTRHNAHKFALEREKEQREKLARKQETNRAKAAVAAVQGKAIAKKKFKGIKIKRNMTIRGIKVKDAESKQKVKEVLAAEEAMKNMAVDDVVASKAKKRIVKKKKVKRADRKMDTA